VSLMVMSLSVVANTVPVMLTDRRLTVNVSLPSVVASTSGVTVNEPALLVISTSPLLVPKSLARVSTVQN
jgi:hypothetical protein